MNVQRAPDPAVARSLLMQIAAGTPAAAPPCLPDVPRVLYGAGKLGAMATRLFRQIGIPIAYFIDQTPPPNGRLLDIPVFCPQEAPQGDRLALPIAVCVVTSAFQPIAAMLQADGWAHVAPVYDVLQAYRNVTGLNNGWFSGPLTPDDQSAIIRSLARWHDDRSRAAHLQFTAWRALREEWSFEDAAVTVEDRYFIPEIVDVLGAHEEILDGGAWRAEVLDAFLKNSPWPFAEAVAVEPDTHNLARLNHWRDTRPDALKQRVRVEPWALSDSDGVSAFNHGQGMASRLLASGADIAQTRRIDSLGITPSFIKLHLEGNELPALHGALSTLQRHRPVLAVTTYHNRDGLWKTPAWLMDNLPDYRFLMRMHGWCGTGAVVYGIPAERSVRPTQKV